MRFFRSTAKAPLFEISMGRCGMLLCHKLSAAAPESLPHCFHTKCVEPFIAILARKETTASRAHARVVFRADHTALAAVLQQSLAA